MRWRARWWRWGVVAAVVGGSIALPPGLHALVIILTAAVAGALWAAIPAVLKVTRGVNEVISTIMMNGLALGLAAYLIGADVFGELRAAGLNVQETDNVIFDGAEAAVARVNLDGAPGDATVKAIRAHAEVLDVQLVSVSTEPPSVELFRIPGASAEPTAPRRLEDLPERIGYLPATPTDRGDLELVSIVLPPRSAPAAPSSVPRATWSRSRSPVAMWGMSKCSAMTVPWVPLPAPGGAIMRTLTPRSAARRGPPAR